VKGRKLPHVVEEFIRLTIECELATSWNNFSAVIGLEEFGIFLGKGMPNFHAKGGNIKVIDALVKAHKGPETTSATVTRIDRAKDAAGNVVVRVTYIKGGQVVTVEGERVILTVPFWRLHQIVIDPPLSQDKWQGITTLQRGAYTVVHLLVDKDASKTWQFEGQAAFPILSDGPLGVIYGVMAETPPSQPFEVFILLVYGMQAQMFHMVPREVKLAELRAELDKLFPGLSKHIHGEYVYSYHPAAIAVWPPGRAPIDAQGKKLHEPELGLYLAGDWTVSGHSNGAVISGTAAADAIAKELKK
jgi:monoamine oxidase